MDDFLLVFHYIPLWFKIAYTAFIFILIPIYWKHYGPANFLWFSDIALFVTCFALWLESSLLASMMAVGVLLPEIAWNTDFFGRLFFGKTLFGLSGYMFEKKNPLYIRVLSLFHVIIPVIIIYLLAQFGYHENAIYWQIMFGWVVMLVVYFFTSPNDNINLVYGPGSKPQKKIHPGLYLIFMMFFLSVVVYFPSHLLLQWIFD